MYQTANPSADNYSAAFKRLVNDETAYSRGRRAAHDYEQQAQMMALSQAKFPTTIDIKFDAQNQEALVKEEALNKYQENAYLLGKIFSVE